MKDIGSTIAAYRKENKLNQTVLASILKNDYGIQITQAGISAWEKGTSQPNVTQFLALCEIFGIYDIYTNFIGKNPENPFRDLNEKGIEKVTDYIHILSQVDEYKLAEIIQISDKRFGEIRVYNNTVSAGTGDFLDSDDFELFTRDETVPDSADFGSRVKGDSMFPDINDRDVVWVQQTSELENGDIGIFYLDGDAYVKKLISTPEGTYLVSTNPKYNPIPIHEYNSFKIFGKVVGMKTVVK